MNVFHQKVWNPDFTQFSSLYFPIMAYGSVFSKFQNWPTVEDLNRWKPNPVISFLSHNICFVEQKGTRQKKCFSSLYEPRVFLKGEVNTRFSSWHDFFNALVWYSFPKVKSTLNMRQFVAFDERASFPWKNPLQKRSREQDLLTMFDEGGCILVHFKNRSLPFLFGHGFYERIAYGDKDLSACTMEIQLDFDFSCPLHFLEMSALKKLLFQVDERVSQILFHRSYYEKEGAFRSVSLKNLSAFLENGSDFQTKAPCLLAGLS